MAMIVRNGHDSAVATLKQVLDEYEGANPGADASLYRQNNASIRVRIVNDRFAGMPKSRRHDVVFDFIASRVDDDTLQELSMLLLFTPDELGKSMINSEFEDPLPSDF